VGVRVKVKLGLGVIVKVGVEVQPASLVMVVPVARETPESSSSALLTSELPQLFKEPKTETEKPDMGGSPMFQVKIVCGLVMVLGELPSNPVEEER
jgi:hypothetical protein